MKWRYVFQFSFFFIIIGKVQVQLPLMKENEEPVGATEREESF